MKTPKHKLVLVVWVDSVRGTEHWETGAYEMKESLECQSVGWVIAESKEAIQLTANISDIEDDTVQRLGELTIPKCSIQKIINIKVHNERATTDRGARKPKVRRAASRKPNLGSQIRSLLVNTDRVPPARSQEQGPRGQEALVTD